MSTHYYELRKPWTHIKCEAQGNHTRIMLWQQYGLAGALTVEKESREDCLYTFFDLDDSVASTVSRGEKGVALIIHRQPRVDVVLSEYANLAAFSELEKAYPLRS